MLDYVPSFIAFLTAMLGMTGKSWDGNQLGLARLTTRGRLVLGLAVVSLAAAQFSTYRNRAKLSEVASARALAHADIMRGIQFIAYPILKGLAISKGAPNSEVFAKLITEEHMATLGKQRLNERSAGRQINVCGSFRDVAEFEIIDTCLEKGAAHLRTTAAIYSGVLDAETVASIAALLTDPFFVSKYPLRENIDLIQLGELDEKSGPYGSPYLSTGLYYFNAIYEGDAKRAGDPSKYAAYVGRIRHLVDHIKSSQSKEISVYRLWL